MKPIQILSQAVADQIAAGEVAERPSAVVKELVENAMDAGAKHIEVEIKQGGIGYIRVTDDGSGIPAEDLEIAFLRHATSKLSAIEDLDNIGTMGFRGEALASICAVAEVEVVTKTAEAEEGCYLELLHGIPQGKEPIACADGTTMVIRKLFANVPARMKFLKKDATEAGYVADVLGRMALSRPDIAFSYQSDGKEIFSTVGDGNLVSVILNLYGLDHAKGVVPVSYKEGNIAIEGVIGKPELARGNRTRQTLFVNGRYVKNHVLAKVAEEAYRNAMMVGKFPFFVLQVNLPSEQVDVNVHPAKTEVKFANEKQVYDVTYHALRNAIYRGTETVKEEEIEESSSVGETSVPRGKASYTMSQREDTPAKGRSYIPEPGEPEVTPQLVQKFLEYTTPKKVEDFSGEPLFLRDSDAEKTEGMQKSGAEVFPLEDVVQEVMLQEEKKPVIQEESLRIVGQVFDTYIVCQRGEEMFLIDQHAAHERLRFEELKKSYLNQERLTQMLLSPLVIQLDYREKQTVMDSLEDFEAFGFLLEDFGGTSVIIHGTPVVADEKEIRDLILELAEALGEQRRHPVADFEERALDMISCKYAIKANHHLSLMEMQDLVERTERMEREGVRTCPHGRPVRISFTKAEIEKLFKRRV